MCRQTLERKGVGLRLALGHDDGAVPQLVGLHIGMGVRVAAGTGRSTAFCRCRRSSTIREHGPRRRNRVCMAREMSPVAVSCADAHGVRP